MSYMIVDVTPDTPEWEQERRNSVGASEVAAVMGLSPWNTALDVYKSKQGVDREFDPLLAWIGHKSETTIADWVHDWSGTGVQLESAFMARSIEFPFLHASFDRVSHEPFMTWQFKTAHQYTGHKWDEGIPTDIRVQVQGEMLVAGTRRAAVVVWIGGREFRLFWEDRDDAFIEDHLLPALTAFWANLQLGVAPPPSTLAEVNTEFPSEAREVELSADAFETLERITVLNSDIGAQEAERDALKVALAQYVETADTLLYGGRRVATWKTQKGRASFDQKRFREDHPDLATEYTSQGAPFRVLRTIKPKETK